MRKRFACFAVTLLLVAAAGCSKANQTQRDHQAIRAALQKYLSGRGSLNLSAMEMDVKQVTIDGNRAQAQVEFHAKQGGGSMQIAYALERQGDVWVVRTGNPSGGTMGHPPMAGDAPPLGPPPSLGDLPAGHPPLTDTGKASAKSPPKKP